MFADRLTRRAAILGVTALAYWALLFFILPTELPFRNDENVYLGGAIALSAGHGYRFEEYVNLPRIGTYPPGYSAWLSLFLKDGQPFAVNSYRMEVANWIAAGCALFVLAMCLFISELPTLPSAVTIMLLGTSIAFTQSMVWLTADVLFIAGSFALALLISAYGRTGKLSLWWFAAGLLTGTLFLVKTAALAYMVGLIVFGFVKRDLRRLSHLVLFGLPVCTVIALWISWTRGIPTYATYFRMRLSEIGGLSGYSFVVLKQAGLYCSGRWIIEALFNVPDRLSAAHAFLGIASLAEALAIILGLAFALPIVLGMIRSPKNPREQITLFLIGAVAVQLVFWPYYLGARGGIVLIPLLVNFFWRGLTSKVASVVFLSILLVNVPGNAWLSYKTIRDQQVDSRKGLAALRQAASWINEAGGRGASVAAGRDVPLIQVSEYLGRRVLANALPANDHTYMDVNPSAQGYERADYLITDSSFEPMEWIQEQKDYRVERIFGGWTVASRRR